MEKENTLVPQIRMNSGYQIPQLGFGTWLAGKDEIGRAVLNAIDVGYRHIDCAQIYQNEKEIGFALETALNSGNVQRQDLFITTKLWNTCHSYEKASKSIDDRIADLRVQYLDLCLIHWPMGYDESDGYIPMGQDGKIIFSSTDFIDTWHAMEDAVYAGKIRSIGLSNFNSHQIERVIQNGRIKPAVLQVEAHPYFPQTKLLDWCVEHDIVFTSYSTLANNQHEFRVVGQPNLLLEPILIEIGENHGKTPAQVALRWGLQKGMTIIPKSVNRFRIEENFDIFDFYLSNFEMIQIENLDRNWRMLPLDRDDRHPDWPFREEMENLFLN
jgi:aldehyde reductase